MVIGKLKFINLWLASSMGLVSTGLASQAPATPTSSSTSMAAHQARPVRVSLYMEPRSGDHLLGAQIWDKPTLRLGPQIVLYDHFYVRGPHVFYDHFRKGDPFELRAGVQLVLDTPQISLVPQEKDYRNQRKTALESQVQFRYKFGFRRLFYVGAKASQGLSLGHSSPYGELLAGSPVLPYTLLNVAVGAGTAGLNRYYYGPEAVAGVNNARLSLQLFIPSIPWDGVAILNSEANWVLQRGNQLADYVRGNSSHLNFSVIAAWNVF